jgi:hypothetical protein
MQPRTEEVLQELDARRAALESAVAAVPPELRERRPAPDRWSVAEILEHVAIVEGQVTGLLAKLVDSARTAGLGPERETGPVVPTVDVARLLDRGRPVTAGPASMPREGLDAEAALAALARQREALRETLLAADGLALSEVAAPNPVLGTLNAYQWVVFVAGHEARHTEQVREAAAALDPPAPAPPPPLPGGPGGTARGVPNRPIH